MTTIKIIQEEIQKAFQDLRSKVEQLEEIPANVSFTTSKLDSAEKMVQIEEQYYDALGQYKAILLQCEKTLSTKIEEFIQREEEIAKDIQ